jgi:hypothetical protein
MALVGEMTRDELHLLIKQSVRQALQEMLEDPDGGLVLRDRVVERPREDEHLDEDGLIPAEKGSSELGAGW